MPTPKPQAPPAVGPLLWLLCFQYFIAEQVARFAWRLPYSMAGNYISDLGAVHCGDGLHTATNRASGICSPLHALMNGSFILQGCLIFVGSLLVRRLLSPGRLLRAALWLIALSGLGVLAVGLAPEDVNVGIHELGATVHFFGGNIGMLVFGLAMLRIDSPAMPHHSVQMTLFALLGGSVGLAATLLLLTSHNLGLGTGGIERVAAYPLPLWLTGMGTFLLPRPGLASQRAPGP